MKKHSLDRLKDNPNNPRTITPKKAAALKRALTRFGDLGGIVLNRRDGTLISGHQRRLALEDIAEAVHIEREYPAGTATGTVAEGYVNVDSERYSYREVDWDETTAKAASLAANNPAGAWSMPALEGWLADIKADGFAMDLTMFDDSELQMYLPPTEQAEPDGPADDYNPETGEVIEFVAHDEPKRPEQPAMRTVQLYYAADVHAKVVDLLGGLQESWRTDNASETVFKALQRCAVTATLGQKGEYMG